MKQVLIALLSLCVLVLSMGRATQATQPHRIVCIHSDGASLAADIKTGLFVFHADIPLNNFDGRSPYDIVGQGMLGKSGNSITLEWPTGGPNGPRSVSVTLDAPESGHQGEFVVMIDGAAFVGHTDDYTKSMCAVVPAGLSEKKLSELGE
jgi:hypothetical protein